MISADRYQTARTHAALIDRGDRGRIVVSGADRATYLQGLLTNDIVAVQPGRGCYTLYLTAQGRMIADLVAYEIGDLMLLSMPGAQKNTVLAKLDQFVFSEDVTLGDVTETFAQIAIVGPEAAQVLAGVIDGVTSETLAALPEHGNLRASVGGVAAILARVTDTGEPGYDVYIERPGASALEARLRAAGAVVLDAETADIIRLEAGVPVFGRDMDEETIPLEAGIEARAISFSKGCYVGQEVIVRVLTRGHGRVARKLVGLMFDGDQPPASGGAVTADGREIGTITSSAVSPALHRPIALAYLHRDFLAPGTRVAVDGVQAVVTQLPFVPRATSNLELRT